MVLGELADSNDNCASHPLLTRERAQSAGSVRASRKFFLYSWDTRNRLSVCESCSVRNREYVLANAV